MTSINSKMGLKPSRARAFMKLPKARAEAVKLTAATCPACQRTGARLSQLQPGWFVCSWCAHTWEPTP
jgi:ribosomal protein L37AE/L43A